MPIQLPRVVWIDAVRKERPSEPQRGTIVVYEIESRESRLVIWDKIRRRSMLRRQDSKEGFADRRAWKEISFASKYLLGLASRHPEQAPLRLRDLGPQRVLERRASARGDDERAPARRRLPECAQICRHKSSGRPTSEAETTPSTRKPASTLDRPCISIFRSIRVCRRSMPRVIGVRRSHDIQNYGGWA